MVYAHRGVDLVVAVMGILKAGATFSVIGIVLVRLSEFETNLFSRSCISTSEADNLPKCRQARWLDRY
jgi:hypothetical protein